MTEKLNNSLIDKDLTLHILERYNRGDFDHVKPVLAQSFPPVDNKTIIDMTGSPSYEDKTATMIANLEKYGIPPGDFIRENRDTTKLNKAELEQIGRRLMSCYSFGILNGGSATSYADSKKNRAFNRALFELTEAEFRTLAEISTGKAKGITPAFINRDGTAGPSFIELKMRSLLLAGVPSLFQMTSHFNNDSVSETYKGYEKSPFLLDLIELRNNNICRVETGVQPLLAAFTHSRSGKKKSLFEKENGDLLPLPGGHGQCFVTLKETFSRLRAKGIRFISIGNVDNSGYTPDPVSLAVLALSGKQAGFDFSFKTPVDVKGGILVKDQNGHLNCADLGVAIDKDVVVEAEKKGDSILFNCATGLFNLDYLMENIDWIIESLPMRFSDQDKDAGLYSQAEQVTWEVIGLLDDILIFAVDKYDRFLAAKLIMENLMTSGIKTDKYPEELKELSLKLNSGLEKKLSTVYGLELIDNRWYPIPAEKLELQS
ncbi:UTP--glucose-1-phosphate uridylyltransferase [Spirochaeta isovalerica]|uniref:UDP-N-acetylglucosamine pyrophosphorylase n=1 Tax=Spirochaeta isovalerica TaxID=150 RepID=A0A841RG19_9SPIO|nr:UTP--glucose-1-phosphate uridylyltransferase [Spirochaeta isovalerica]MBB6481292.1 UDP-N-acetylglucosamine pyrophosphorylase [Spirochaeta isovalerica]